MKKEKINPKSKEIPKTFKAFIMFTLQEIIYQKKWLLLPIWVLLVLITLLLVLSGNSHLLPVIYLGLF